MMLVLRMPFMTLARGSKKLDSCFRSTGYPATERDKNSET